MIFIYYGCVFLDDEENVLSPNSNSVPVKLATLNNSVPSSPPDIFSKISSVNLTTSQLVVVMETESCDALPAIQCSVNNITAKLNVNSEQGEHIQCFKTYLRLLYILTWCTDMRSFE